MAALDKELVHLLVPIVHLDVALCRQVIGGPSTDAAPFSSYPASYDLAKIRVPAAKSCIEVLSSCVLSKIKVWYIGKDALYSQVKCRDSRQPGHVQSPSEARLSRVRDGRKFIFRKRNTV